MANCNQARSAKNVSAVTATPAAPLHPNTDCALFDTAAITGPLDGAVVLAESMKGVPVTSPWISTGVGEGAVTLTAVTGTLDEAEEATTFIIIGSVSAVSDVNGGEMHTLSASYSYPFAP